MVLTATLPIKTHQWKRFESPVATVKNLILFWKSDIQKKTGETAQQKTPLLKKQRGNRCSDQPLLGFLYLCFHLFSCESFSAVLKGRQSEELKCKLSFSGACLDLLNLMQKILPSISSLVKLLSSTWLCQ